MNGRAASFPARPALTSTENATIADVARRHNTFAETVGTIFEIHSSHFPYDIKHINMIAALLADDLGRDAMTMVVTGVTAAAQSVRDRTNLRVFPLDNALPKALRESPINSANFPGWCCPAWKMLKVRDDLSHLEEELKNKVLPCVGLSSLLLVENEQWALEYQKRYRDLSQARILGQTAFMPNILALDGFKLSSAGWFGGRNGKKISSLVRLPPKMPHFAFQGVLVPHLESHVASLENQRVRLQSIETEIANLARTKAAIDARLQQREQESTSRGFQLSRQPVASRPNASGAAASSHYTLRHSATRSAEEAGLHGRQDGARRTRYN